MVQEVEFKTILGKSKVTPYWYYSDYNVNFYRGCSHGCIYCDSRSDCYGIEEFDVVKVKKNAIAILETEMMKKNKRGIISTGAMSDPYNPADKELQVSKKFLELANKYKYGVLIMTKSNLVLRDINELVEINTHSPVIVIFTITTYDEEMCKKIEPYVSTTKERFDAIKILVAAGIKVGITLMPILPFINDTNENIENIVCEAANSGVKFIYPWFGVTLRANQKEYFFNELANKFPKELIKYQKYYHKYKCESFNKSLYAVLAKECNKHGIEYKMNKIVEVYKNDFIYDQLSIDDF